GQFQPALDTALMVRVAVVILDAMPPFDSRGAVAETRDHNRVLDRNRALVIVPVQRPGLHLTLVELAAVQKPMERMQAVIACRADPAQRRFELARIVEGNPLADRIGGHGVRGHDVHSTISVPSAGICQPARSAILRSCELFSSAGFELLICRNTFLSISRLASVSMAPRSPDIAICPIP